MPSGPAQSPVATREAATVVLLRPGPAGSPEIYMVRRSARSPFMPSTLVFPGGRVDPEDGEGQARYAHAARRECFEEVGLALGDTPLHWFDTWVTPSGEGAREGRRYEARFFAAFLAAGAGQEARADGHETHDGRWATATAHLERWSGALDDLPPPTLATLLHLRRLGTVEPTALVPPDAAAPILPKLVEAGGHPTIVMPHDPDYDALPGEGHPAPDRARLHPMRFVRDDTRWMPWPA